MLISRKLLTKRLVRTPNASTGLGIDVGQFHTKIVWLERTTAGQYRASAIKLPSTAELLLRATRLFRSLSAAYRDRPLGY